MLGSPHDSLSVALRILDVSAMVNQSPPFGGAVVGPDIEDFLEDGGQWPVPDSPILPLFGLV